MTTTLPEETEQALYRATDARWWPYINLYLVTWGQNVCRPVYPRCGDCAIGPIVQELGWARRTRVRTRVTSLAGRVAVRHQRFWSWRLIAQASGAGRQSRPHRAAGPRPRRAGPISWSRP